MIEAVAWAFVGLLLAYLVGQVAYERGRKDKWEELTRDYICIHKTCIMVRDEEKSRKSSKKLDKKLDNRSKKKYNRNSYRK